LNLFSVDEISLILFKAEIAELLPEPFLPTSIVIGAKSNLVVFFSPLKPLIL
jgi:hypothetical protein